MTAAPLLSICVPTYNRSEWLEASLRALAPQIQASHGLAELVVCDNCSTDRTAQVAREMQEVMSFRYYRNDANLGPIGNMDRLVRELAQGEYAWVIGDDDIVCDNAIKTIIESIQSNLDIDYIHLNYYSWTPAGPEDVLQISSLKDADLKIARNDLGLYRMKKAVDLIADDIHCFTPIYCSIIRRQLYKDVFQEGAQLPMFSSLASTVPQAQYIVSNLLSKPVFYIGQPATMASCGISWEDFAPIYVLHLLPTLYDLTERCGGDRRILDRHRRAVLKSSPDKLWSMLFDRQEKNCSQFSFWTFAVRNARFIEFWRLLLDVEVKVIYAATPKQIRLLWKYLKTMGTKRQSLS